MRRMDFSRLGSISSFGWLLATASGLACPLVTADGTFMYIESFARERLYIQHENGDMERCMLGLHIYGVAGVRCGDNAEEDARIDWKYGADFRGKAWVQACEFPMLIGNRQWSITQVAPFDPSLTHIGSARLIEDVEPLIRAERALLAGPDGDSEFEVHLLTFQDGRRVWQELSIDAWSGGDGYRILEQTYADSAFDKVLIEGGKIHLRRERSKEPMEVNWKGLAEPWVRRHYPDVEGAWDRLVAGEGLLDWEGMKPLLARYDELDAQCPGKIECQEMAAIVENLETGFGYCNRYWMEGAIQLGWHACWEGSARINEQ